MSTTSGVFELAPPRPLRSPLVVLAIRWMVLLLVVGVTWPAVALTLIVVDGVLVLTARHELHRLRTENTGLRGQLDRICRRGIAPPDGGTT